jgi:hypothetical protein
MTKIRSITDIASLYESVRNNENSLIEEKANKTPKNTFPPAGKEVKTSKAFNEAGPEKVKGFTKIKKNKKKRGKVNERNINSFMKSKFDKLFENVMDDEMDVKMDLGPGVGPEGESEDMDMDIENETGGDEVTFTLDRETAQKLHDVLMSVLGGEEESGEEESDLEDLGIEDEGDSAELEGGEDLEDEDEQEMEDEDEENYFEEVGTEKLADAAGHKLTKAGTVGSVKASKGKASADVTDETGTSTLGNKGEALSKAGNHVVGNLKKGGSLFS